MVRITASLKHNFFTSGFFLDPFSPLFNEKRVVKKAASKKIALYLAFNPQRHNVENENLLLAQKGRGGDSLK